MYSDLEQMFSRPEPSPSRPGARGGGGRAGPGQPGAAGARPGWGGKSISGVNTNKSIVAKPWVRRVLSAEFIASAGTRSPGWAGGRDGDPSCLGAGGRRRSLFPQSFPRLGQRLELRSLVGEIPPAA